MDITDEGVIRLTGRGRTDVGSEPVLTAALCRAARVAMQWSQLDLAAHSGVSRVTLADWERGARSARRSNRLAVQTAFEKAGICFLAPVYEDGLEEPVQGPGMRLPVSAG